MKTLITLGLTFTCLIYSCKKDSPTIFTEDMLTETYSSKHFDYYFSKNDSAIIDTFWQEKYYAWLVEKLQVNVQEKIQYYKYRDNAHIKRVTGKMGNGFAELETYKIHTIWEEDNHESVHIIVTQLIGHPPAIFNEGIAVAHQANYFKYPVFIPDWNGQDFNILAKNFKQNGKIPPLDKLLGIYSFWDYGEEITYPVSGSFVQYLIKQYGLEKMKSFITICDFNDSKEKIRAYFNSTYGISIEAAWSEWNYYISN